jgi:acetolactate synthase-1/2/3 large subunit
MARMRCAEALVKQLEKEGVHYVFGLPGHGNMNILDALYDSPIQFKLVRHEQAAVHIADGYARVSGQVGVCCSSVGPGAANMIEGVAVAMAASSPVLAINGGPLARMVGKGQLQETSRPDVAPTDEAYLQMLQPITKRVWMAEEPSLIPSIVRHAIHTASSGRPGPVAIEVPWDLQAEYCDGFEFIDPKDHAYGHRLRADREQTIVAAEKLLAAEFPVILAGNGAVLSGAGAEVKELAELLGAPIATSFVSKGLVPEDDPLSIGMVGWLGHPVAHEVIRERADYILAIGYSFSDEGTSWWTEGYPYVQQNRFIQVDLEPREIAKNYPVEVGLVGDAKAVLQDLIAEIKSRGGRSGRERNVQAVQELKRAYHHEMPPDKPGEIEPIWLAQELRRILPRDSILSVDTGSHAHYFAAFYPIYGPKRLLNPGAWTPMGWGPVAIIGAKLAEPQTPCISVTGDGGFFMVCQEVITAVEWQTPVVWVVFNNLALTAIRQGQMAAYNKRVIGTEFNVRADFSAMARAFGAEGIRVKDCAEFRPAMERALNCGRPCVIDVITPTDPVPPPVAGKWCEPIRAWPEPFLRGSTRPQPTGLRRAGM